MSCGLSVGIYACYCYPCFYVCSVHAVKMNFPDGTIKTMYDV